MPTHSILLFLHVLGASIWFGGHMVLSFVVLPKAKRAGNPGQVADFEAAFERIGLPSLAVQALTGPVLALRHAKPEDWFRWENGTQDHIASKLILVVVMVAMAVHRRSRLRTRLRAGESMALKSAARHIHTMTFLSFLMILTGLSLHTYGFAS